MNSKTMNFQFIVFEFVDGLAKKSTNIPKIESYTKIYFLLLLFGKRHIDFFTIGMLVGLSIVSQNRFCISLAW